MEEELENLKLTVKSIYESMEFFNKKYEEMAGKVRHLEKENFSLKTENSSLKSHLAVITSTVKEQGQLIDDLEQYIRRDCLEFKGIPERDDEDTDEIIKSIGELLDVDVKDDDISISHRLPNTTDPRYQNNQPPTIIAKFVKRSLKEKLYRARYRLKDKSTSDLEGFEHCSDDNGIFISESLTHTRRKLFKSCLKVRKELNYKIASSTNGRIFLKQDTKSRPVYINSESDLAKLKARIKEASSFLQSSNQQQT